MNTTTTLFLCSDLAMYTSPRRTYARVGVRDPAHMYTYVAVFSLLHTGRYTYVYMLRAHLYYDTCAPLLRHVRASTSTSMYVHVRDQNDNAMYASTRWVPTIRHFLACEDVAGGSQQSGGESFFCPNALPCVRRCSWWVPAVRGRIIFLPIIWTHFLACEDVAGGSQQSGGNVFLQNTVAHPVGPCCQVEESLFCA